MNKQEIENKILSLEKDEQALTCEIASLQEQDASQGYIDALENDLVELQDEIFHLEEKLHE